MTDQDAVTLTEAAIDLVYEAAEKQGQMIFLDEGYTARSIALDLWDEATENHVSAALDADMEPATPTDIAWNVARALGCIMDNYEPAPKEETR